ncbi:FtsX-like permease family protein [Tsukamurella sp. 8F]|uniref:ABC transporter permease n=1 Tax=unclassified Tsukamurella TaxID=2633480 RepID=UPI0023B9A69B|nr:MULTISPECIES: ABC transporter permease [unclassified Tsukamurella]MDF0529887.1 FtsX-like permease family protein [Tsukamurella sp. 8J]MDF0588658.1 FtsX-like permease family protein [Tsukamurella sp. 8F]
MGVMRKVALRNLLAHKGRLFLTALSVLLGTSFIAGSLVFTGTLSRAFDTISSMVAIGVDVRVSPQQESGLGDPGGGASSPGVPLTVAKTVEADPNVRVVVPALTGSVALRDGHGKVVTSQGPPLIGGEYLPPGRNLDPDALALTSGRAPAGPGEVAINAGAADRLDLHDGARTQVVTARSPAPLTVTVVGVYQTNSDVGGFVGLLFAHDEAERQFGNGTTVPYVDIGVKGESAEQAKNRLAAQFPQYRVQTGDEVRSEFSATVDQTLSFVNYFLVAFGMIGLLVGVFIIYNTFSMLVAQRLAELALLRAVGASRGQVRRSVVLEAVIVGLLGSAAGLGVGVALAVGMRALIAALGGGFPDSSLSVSPATIVVVLVVGTAVTVVAALVPAARAARVPPVAAMRAQDGGSPASIAVRGAIGGALALNALALLFVATTESGKTAAIMAGIAGVAMVAAVPIGGPALAGPVLGGLGRVLAAPFGPSGRLARTNVIRNPQRTSATAFALVIGVALVAVIGTLGSSMQKTVDQTVDTGLRSDLVLMSPGLGMPLGAIDAAAGTAGVGDRVVTYRMPVTIGKDRTVGGAVEGDLSRAIALDVTAGSAHPDAEGMLVDSKTAEEKGWQVGTSVELGSLLDAPPQRVTVAGIYTARPGLAQGWLVSAAVMDRLYPAAAGAKAGLLSPQAIFVHVTPGASTADVQARLRAAVDRFMTVQVDDANDMKDQQGRQISQLMGVLYGLLGLAVVIAVLGIINTLALSVVERRREIGMLRAVGMLRAQVRRSIYLESMLIAIFGALLGLVLGVLLGASLVHALRDQGLSAVRVPWTTLLVMLVGSGFVGILAAILPGIRASRIPPLAAIAGD